MKNIELSEWDITLTFSAIIGQELGLSCRCVSRDTCTEVAALCVSAGPPVPADISHILALVVICGEEMRTESKVGY